VAGYGPGTGLETAKRRMGPVSALLFQLRFLIAALKQILELLLKGLKPNILQ